MKKTVACRTVLCMIVACIAVGAICHAQLSLKNESSPLYEYRAAQAAEEFGLALSGSANNGLEFGSTPTTGLTVNSDMTNIKPLQTPQKPLPPATSTKPCPLYTSQQSRVCQGQQQEQPTYPSGIMCHPLQH
jgi:hypothetical protein